MQNNKKISNINIKKFGDIQYVKEIGDCMTCKRRNSQRNDKFKILFYSASYLNQITSIKLSLFYIKVSIMGCHNSTLWKSFFQQFNTRYKNDGTYKRKTSLINMIVCIVWPESFDLTPRNLLSEKKCFPQNGFLRIVVFNISLIYYY